jgi:hypothetical protein
LTEAITAGTGIGQGMNNVTAIRDQRGAGIIRVLEYRAQQDALIGLEYAFNTIAMVNIEIDNRDPVKACGQGMAAPTAALLEMQNPIALSRPAWYPGGRTPQNTVFASLCITISTPCSMAPATRQVARAGPSDQPKQEHPRWHKGVVATPYGCCQSPAAGRRDG